MSPTCMIKPKQLIYQQKSKSKYRKNIPKHKVDRTMERKIDNDENIYIELDTKCSCPQSRLNNNANIQFSRRYLQCQSSMPIAFLRSFIEQILPHSSMTQLTLYDSNDRLLQDSDLLRSLKQTHASLQQHIPIRFILFNTITSFGHCLCSSSSIEQKRSSSSSSSSSPTIIKRETIDRTLSTCSFAQTTPISPCLSSSSPIESPHSISIVNLLTPPSSLIENLTDSTSLNDQSIIDEITSQFGEICPPLPKKVRYRLPKKLVSKLSSNVPLDLSLKKRRPSSFDLFSSQAKWIKT